jgi:hypothetical protein
MFNSSDQEISLVFYSINFYFLSLTIYKQQLVIEYECFSLKIYTEVNK